MQSHSAVLVSILVLAVGCGRSEPMSRSDSLALAASGGVRTDSGAVPMRISRTRVGQGDEVWSESPGTEPPGVEMGDEGSADATLEHAQQDAERQAEEAVAEAEAQTEMANAAMMDELHEAIERQRRDMRQQHRMLRQQMREQDRVMRDEMRRQERMRRP